MYIWFVQQNPLTCRQVPDFNVAGLVPKVAALYTISTMCLDIAFRSVVNSALGTCSPPTPVFALSAIMMRCAVLPHSHLIVSCTAHGLTDKEQKMRTMTALAIVARHSRSRSAMWYRIIRRRAETTVARCYPGSQTHLLKLIHGTYDVRYHSRFLDQDKPLYGDKSLEKARPCCIPGLRAVA